MEQRQESCLIGLNGSKGQHTNQKQAEALTEQSEKLPHYLEKEARSTDSSESRDATLKRSSAATDIADLGFAYTRPPAFSYHSHTKSVPPDQLILQPVSPERLASQGKVYPTHLDVDTIGIREAQKAATEEPGASPSAADLARPTRFTSTLKMVLYPPNGRPGTRIGKLDTGSKVNVISQKVMDTLGIKIEPYEGPDLTPIGPNIRPLGSITLDWHVMTRKKTYTTTFVVLNTSLSEGFDILLGEETIREIGIYQDNRDVFFLNLTE